MTSCRQASVPSSLAPSQAIREGLTLTKHDVVDQWPRDPDRPYLSEHPALSEAIQSYNTHITQTLKAVKAQDVSLAYGTTTSLDSGTIAQLLLSIDSCLAPTGGAADVEAVVRVMCSFLHDVVNCIQADRLLEAMKCSVCCAPPLTGFV